MTAIAQATLVLTWIRIPDEMTDMAPAIPVAQGVDHQEVTTVRMTVAALAALTTATAAHRPAVPRAEMISAEALAIAIRAHLLRAVQMPIGAARNLLVATDRSTMTDADRPEVSVSPYCTIDGGSRKRSLDIVSRHMIDILLGPV